MNVDSEAQVARREIGETARRMLTGSLSFIEGARRIVGLSHNAKLNFDPDIVPFVGIDSETDALPIGDVRRHWAPEALEKPRPEIDRMEKWAREFGTRHCENLIKRFAARN
jgi:hypothetical protein